MFYTYIIQSELNGSFYKGSSNDVLRRLEEHNAGKEKSTARYRPWKLAWYTGKPTRAEALLLEKKLKNITSKAKTEQFIKKHMRGGPDAA